LFTSLLLSSLPHIAVRLYIGSFQTS
jgi:hypothetical protein